MGSTTSSPIPDITPRSNSTYRPNSLGSRSSNYNNNNSFERNRSSYSNPKPESFNDTNTMRRECQICFDSQPTYSFVKITSNCNHGLDICKSCVIRHIETQLSSKGELEITCLSSGCNRVIQHNDIKNIVSKELFERYDILMLRQTLSNYPEFRWCKNSGCGSGQINFDGDDAPIMTCEGCSRKSCYTHDVPWHDGFTCSEYDVKRQGDDEATQDLLNRETKPCPKCGVRITKSGGCNHMTCKVKSCKYEFCWLCLADYNDIRKRGNKAHKRTCQLFA